MKDLKISIKRFASSGGDYEPSIRYSNNPRLEINSDLRIEGTERNLRNVDWTLTHLTDIHDARCNIGGLYETTDSAVDPNTFLPGTWTLLSSNVIDTGWQNFSWTNSTYIGTTQSSYTLNKWRITDNVLHVVIGAGCTSTINHDSEDEIARIPIANSGLNESATRIWTGAVGGSGCVAGFSLKETTNGMTVGIKPHTSSQFSAAPWYSTYFTYPLPSNFVFKSGSYKRKYIWERTS